MASIEQQAKGKKEERFRYLTPLNIETQKLRNIVVSKDLVSNMWIIKMQIFMSLLTNKVRLLPRRLTGTSLKYQRKVAVAVKRARHLALMPYVADLLK